MAHIIVTTLYAFISTWAIMLTYNLSVRNPLSLVLFAGIEILFLQIKKIKDFNFKPSVIISSLLLSISTVLVKTDGVLSAFDNKLFKLLAFTILFVGFGLFFFYLVNFLYKLADKVNPKMLFVEDHKLPSFSIFSISFIVCVICYLPWYLYSFPGIMDPDSITQLSQVTGVNPYSNHHPVFHTFMIKACCKIASLFTSDLNKQVGFYTLIQMIFFSFCAAYVIFTLHKYVKLRTSLCFVCLAFYTLVSFMSVQAVFICKDTVFAAFTMLFVCELCKLVYENKKEDAKNIASEIFSVVRFVILGFAFCIFRTNGWYAFLLFSVLFLIIFIKDWKKVLVRIIPVIAIVLIVKGPVMNSLNIKQPDIAESLHVPEQQIAAVIANDRCLAEEETKLLYDVCDISYAKEFYVPWFADNIKELVRAGHPEVISENKFTYLKLWAKIGLRYPADYIRAWTALVENVIFPEGDYDVAIIEGVKSNSLGVDWHPIIGNHFLLKAREILIKLGDFIPLYGFLWSMGSYTWLFILSLGKIFANKKDCRKAIILLPAICIIVTLLLAIPSAKLFRYAFSYATLLPFCLIMFSGKNAND